MTSVYDGRTCIGFLRPCGKLRVEAFDAKGRSLGIFPNAKAAADAASAAGVAPTRGNSRRPRTKQHKRRAGRPRGARNKLTVERELRAKYDHAKGTGQMLAVDVLREGMHFALSGLRQYTPFGKKGKHIKGGNDEKSLRFAKLLLDYARSLAPYESPKLGAVLVAQAPRPGRRTVVHVNIFNDRDERVAEVIDGEARELIEDQR